MNRYEPDLGRTATDEEVWTRSSGSHTLVPDPSHLHERSQSFESWLPTAAPATVEADRDPGLGPDRRRSLLRTTGAIAAALTVTAAMCAAAAAVLGNRSPEFATAEPTAASATFSLPTTTEWCPAGTTGERITGNGAGSAESGPQVILALEHAYYVDRDAAAVRTVLAPDGRFGSDAEIQAGIDAVPAGTTHCTDITAAGPDRWSVLVSERRPDGHRVSHSQTIHTTHRDGRTLIFAVVSA
ncbi:hypothetical protein IU444_28590 [Nocardia farcinica]|uniref:hypothetical protein n=1 Tax=Nocardia TaxID=1817 RepID=UPI000FD8A522|nr:MULTISPECIES: hypothetical protein [Nocardia]MBF6314042.1 hypothetical protein [Nocardia farcinica]MBF6388089.1 hypothetical protein [Nocardia farcinica]UEX20790.1 hypothetical protein LMJ57_17330 [Nocardia farcinica]